MMIQVALTMIKMETVPFVAIILFSVMEFVLVHSIARLIHPTLTLEWSLLVFPVNLVSILLKIFAKRPQVVLFLKVMEDVIHAKMDLLNRVCIV